jgi:hypothetical protein
VVGEYELPEEGREWARRAARGAAAVMTTAAALA